jgi:ferritin
MISEKMRQALNGQINAEIYSSYLYLSMSAWFHSLNLPGCANWMRVQTQEELVHAVKLYDFVNGRGGRVELQAIEAPSAEWDSPLAAFQAAYQHEQKVTGLINSLVSMALAEQDHATNIFLQWFVTEQVEEEASANDVAQKLKLVGRDGSGLLMIDRELAARVFTSGQGPRPDTAPATA